MRRRDGSPPEDAVEHERAAAQEREPPERQADRLVEVCEHLADSEGEVEASDDAAEDRDPPRRALRRHERTLHRGDGTACNSTSPSWAGLMLPPLQTSATRFPRAGRAGQRRRRAARRPPPPRGCACVSIIATIAARISSSETSTKSSSCSHMIALRQLERDARGEPLGERLHAILEQPALLPRSVGRRRRVGLDADHLDAGAHRLGGDARARRAAAAAHRHDDHVDRRLVLEQLERRGADAGDQLRLVAGVDVAVAVLGCELRRSARAPRRSRGRARRSRRRGLASPRP